MPSLLVNWKTTFTGIAAILGALGTVATDASNGNVDPTHLWLAFTAIASGVGLVAAQDAKKNT